MRLVLVVAMLASACDQGAIAAPPPASAHTEMPPPPPPPPPRVGIRDTADYTRQALVLFEQIIAIFADDTRDCDVLATRVEGFGAQNATQLHLLMTYSKDHPEVNKVMEQQFKPRIDVLIKKLTPVFTTCSANQRFMGAFQKLSEPPKPQLAR